MRCRQIAPSFRRKPESRDFRIQIILSRRVILDSGFRRNDGNKVVAYMATQFDDTCQYGSYCML